jgi:hypothetical protein
MLIYLPLNLIITTMEKVFTQLGLVTVVLAVLIGGFAVTHSYGQANAITTRESVPFIAEGIPYCGDEAVTFSGHFNLVSHVTVGPDGMFEYSVTHLNYQGVSGVTTSGDRVVLSESQNAIANVRQISANEFITQIHGTAISQGKAANTLAEIHFHTIINANGEPTSTVEHVEIKCQGQGTTNG